MGYVQCENCDRRVKGPGHQTLITDVHRGKNPYNPTVIIDLRVICQKTFIRANRTVNILPNCSDEEAKLIGDAVIDQIIESNCPLNQGSKTPNPQLELVDLAR